MLSIRYEPSFEEGSHNRLADVLQWLSRDNTWEEVENHLSQHLVQVYQLHEEPIRLDSTTASVYHDTEGNTLFRHGHSKDHRPDLPTLQASVGGILRKHGVTGLLDVSYICKAEQRSIRKYKDRPARTEKTIRYVTQVKRNHQAIYEARRSMGWRLYVTNAPVQKLSLSKAVRVFRKAPLMERNFARLKGRPLGIHPLYVRREDHTQGLVRLLSLALRVLTLVEHVARKNLQSAGEKLTGLYAGNPKRQTAMPTTERLLKAFGTYIPQSSI